MGTWVHEGPTILSTSRFTLGRVLLVGSRALPPGRPIDEEAVRESPRGKPLACGSCTTMVEPASSGKKFHRRAPHRDSLS